MTNTEESELLSFVRSIRELLEENRAFVLKSFDGQARRTADQYTYLTARMQSIEAALAQIAKRIDLLEDQEQATETNRYFSSWE